MVKHPLRAGESTPSGSAHDGKKSRKPGKQTPKHEPETQPVTPGLLTPSSAPVTPGLLTPASVSASWSPGAAGSGSAGDTSRSQGSKGSTGREQKQEATLSPAATPTLSLDSLVISDAKSLASPSGLPGLHAYTMSAHRNLKKFPTSASPASPKIEVSSSSVRDPGLVVDEDCSDKDMMKLAERLMGMLDEDSILYVAHELQSQGYLQEFTLELPMPLGQQLPPMMLHQVPLVAQQTFPPNQQLLQSAAQPHLEQFLDLQQVLSTDSQDSQPRVDSFPQDPQPGSDSQSPQTLSGKDSFVQQMQHSNNVLQKVMSSGSRSAQLQLDSVLEEPESPPASPRLEEQAASIQEALTPELSQPDDAAIKPPYLRARTLQNETRISSLLIQNISSLLIQNLPRSFSQKATRDWVDSHGYRDLYDMLMWFPAKQSSKQTESRAFINFRSTEHAKRFRREFHHTEMSSSPGQGTTQIAITSAKEQGFTANFIRFWHLTQNQDKEAKHLFLTVCPFFARDMVATVSAEEKKLAEANLSQPFHENKLVAKKGKPEWDSTTLAIRNLPEDVYTQSRAIGWLTRNGHEGFDFLLFVPRKQNYKARSSVPGGLAYLFVNFSTAAKAHACARSLHNLHVGQGAPNLSVVAARIQGYQACWEHFQDLAKSGRLVPWFDPAMEKRMGRQEADAGKEDDKDEQNAEGDKTIASDARSERPTESPRHIFQ